jgi:hypothetical protein
MKFLVAFSQKETEKKIMYEIHKAEKFIVIHTMFFNEKNAGGMCVSFINILNEKIKNNPNIYIELNIGLNPFLIPYIKGIDKRICVNLINPRKIFCYVHHTRLFHTENIMCIGGIDFTNIINSHPEFVQFCIFIKSKKYFILNKKYFRNVTLDNFYNYTSYNHNFMLNKHKYVSNVSYKDQILYCIKHAKSDIFFDHQYFLYYPIVEALIKKKQKSKDINIYILTNLYTSKNPFGNIKLTIPLFYIFFKNMLHNSGIKILKNNNYTHNKLCIFDKKYIMMGSMNLIGRSIECNKNEEKEIGIFLNNSSLAKILLDKYNMNEDNNID